MKVLAAVEVGVGARSRRADPRCHRPGGAPARRAVLRSRQLGATAQRAEQTTISQRAAASKGIAVPHHHAPVPHSHVAAAAAPHTAALADADAHSAVTIVGVLTHDDQTAGGVEHGCDRGVVLSQALIKREFLPGDLEFMSEMAP